MACRKGGSDRLAQLRPAQPRAPRRSTMSAPDRPRDSGHFPGLHPSSPGLAVDGRTPELGPAAHSRRTMPPPELLDRPAPASVGALVLENIRAEAPVSRHTGPAAEEA